MTRTSPATFFDKGGNNIDTFSGLHSGDAVGTFAAHASGIGFYDFQRRADHGRKISLIDDKEIRVRDAGPAFARDFLAVGHIDHVNRDIGQLRAEGRRQARKASVSATS